MAGFPSSVLVDADWAQAHLNDRNVRFVEVDVDTAAYDQSHLPGAVGWNWTSQLSDGIRRDIASQDDFSALLSASGIAPDTYGVADIGSRTRIVWHFTAADETRPSTSMAP